MAVSEHSVLHWVQSFGRPILLSIDFLEHRCYNVLCCGMLPQVHGCLDVGPFVCILLGSSLPAGATCQHFYFKAKGPKGLGSRVHFPQTSCVCCKAHLPQLALSKLLGARAQSFGVSQNPRPQNAESVLGMGGEYGSEPIVKCKA